MQKPVLVTGGAGFIGSHLVEALVGRGVPVRVLDNFSTGLRDNLAGVHPAPEVVEGDLEDVATVARAVDGIEIIFHLGPLPPLVDEMQAQPELQPGWVAGTLHVLSTARRAGVRRIVYAASGCVYGGLGGPEGPTEDSVPLPLSPYAAAKLAGESYAQAFSATYGLETVSLRFFGLFGPRQRTDSPYSGVIPQFIAAMSAGQAPVIHGDGLQAWDFTYVDNAVEGLLKAAEVPGITKKVFNIGTGRSIRLLEVVAALNRLLGTDLAPQHAPPRRGEVCGSPANIERARQELGYEPLVSFEEGLARTLDWYARSRSSQPAAPGGGEGPPEVPGKAATS
jgi:UDP-glucose 4-epimerase